MTNRSRLFYLSPAGLVLALLFFAAATGVAQSGRHLPRSSPSQSPEPQSSAAEKKLPQEEKIERSFIVSIDKFGSFASIPLSFYTTVLKTCAQGLDDAPSVKAGVAQNDMGRGDAVNRAKAEKESYVVWLQLRPDTVSVDNKTSGNLSQIYIEYSVFAPSTARLVTSGRTFQQRGVGKGGVRVERPTSIPTGTPYNDYLLKQAASDAAEQILKAVGKSPGGGVKRPGS
jgi:hypothetical protein